MGGLNVIQQLVESSLREDLKATYSRREPGNNVDEVNIWIKRAAKRLAGSSNFKSGTVANEIDVAEMAELRYDSLPVSLKKKIITIESEVRGEAAKARAARALEDGQARGNQKSKTKLVFSQALKVLDGPGRQYIVKKVRASRKGLSEAELSELVRNLESLAKQLDGPKKLSADQLYEVRRAAFLGFDRWPDRYREYLISLNKSVEDQIGSEAYNASRELTLKRALGDIAQRKGHNERVQAAREALAAARKEREERAAAEKAAEEELEALRQVELERQRLKLEAERAARKHELSQEIESDFNGFVNRHLGDLDADGLHREALAEHIQNWAQSNLGANLDGDQALAVASTMNHTQVVARAGSGKTLTLAVRLCFLQLGQKVGPNQIMALVFNKKAQEEITSRVKRYLIFHNELQINGAESAKSLVSSLSESENETNKALDIRGISVPLIMTFHGLAHKLISANLGKTSPQQIEGDDGGANALLDSVTRDLLHGSKGDNLLRPLLSQYFRDDLERLADSKVSGQALVEIRKHLPLETLKGEIVKSRGERVIANWLFTHGVDYYYESATWTEDRYVYPDFKIALKGQTPEAVIEYTGLIGDYDYDKDMASKRSAYRARGIRLLELTPADITDDSRLEEKLERFLHELGLKNFSLLSKDEIWNHVRQRIVGDLKGSRFNRAISQFIKNALRNDLSSAQIRKDALVRLADDPVGLSFANIAADVLEEYLKRLSDKNQIDQTQALNLAISLLRKSKTDLRFEGRSLSVSELRYISVDEHQDFSRQFSEMLNLLHEASGAQIFAVGDDWQCINRFAGSEPELFHSFSFSWQNSLTLQMSNNYRSRPEIVSAGNEVMRSSGGSPGLPTKPNGGLVSLFFVDKTAHRTAEASHVKDLTLRVLRRLLIEELSKSQTHEIVILTRTNTPPWSNKGRGPQIYQRRNFESLLEDLIPGLTPETRSRIKTNTVHGFKGLQSDVVIVMDVQERNFPLLHGDSRFQNFFGESLDALKEDERRLLYVAVTRPIERLYVLTRSGVVSPFLTKGLLSRERDINQFSSAFRIRATSKSYFDESTSQVLAQADFSIYASGRPQKTAFKDVTSYVLNSGGMNLARSRLVQEPPPWLRSAQALGCSFEIEEDFGN